MLGGHCRDCGAPFSMRYFLVELLTTVVFIGVALNIGYSLALIPALIFASMLIVGAFTDIDHWIIPDRVTLGGVVVGVALAAIWPIGWAAGNPLAPAEIGVIADWLSWAPRPVVPLVHSLAGAAVGFCSLWAVGALGTLVFRKEAMGFGDVKLFAMFGAFMGVVDLFFVLMLASVLGTAAGIAGMLAGQLDRRDVDPAVRPLEKDEARAEALAAVCPPGPERELVLRALTHPGPVGAVRHHLPFGPSLSLAAVIVYVFHPELHDWIDRWLYPFG